MWAASPPFDGEALREVLPGIPHGPPFRHVMDAQVGVMTDNKGGGGVWVFVLFVLVWLRDARWVGRWPHSFIHLLVSFLPFWGGLEM